MLRDDDIINGMKKLLAKILHLLVPHRQNKNVPSILKETSMLALICLILGLFILTQNSGYITEKLNLTAAVYPAVLADLANKDREAEGVKALAWSPTLAAAAELKAEDMFKNQYFAHTSPAGITPWYWLTQTHYNFAYAGENLAIRFTESEDVEKAWLNSPTHKENIVNEKFTEIGIAALDGDFEGRNTTIIVEYFGSPVVLVPFVPAPEPVAVNTPAPLPAPAPLPKPVIAGAESNNPLVTRTIVPKVEVVQEEPKFVVVKNIDETLVEASPAPAAFDTAPQVPWYERFVVNPANAVRAIYISLMAMVTIAISLMLLSEYEKRHLKHLSFGLGLIVLLVILLQALPAGVFV